MEFAAANSMPTLRHLEIDLHRDQDVRRVLQALSRLHLSELEMYCLGEATGLEECVFLKMQRERSAWISLPSLVSCAVSCSHEEEDVVVHEWPFFGSLPALRKLTLGCGARVDIHPDALSQLKALESVKLSNNFGIELASRIGQPVVEASIDDGYILDANDISKLSACPRLSKLQVTIYSGAEVSLYTTSALRTLTIHFWPEDNGRLSELEAGMMLRLCRAQIICAIFNCGEFEGQEAAVDA